MTVAPVQCDLTRQSAKPIRSRGMVSPQDMKVIVMTTPIKALFATIATGAMAVCAAAPAMAQDFGHGRFDNGWRNGNSRNAVAMCTSVAERQATRRSDGNARVTGIRDVRMTRFGQVVTGNIAVNTRIDIRDRHNDWHDRGYRNDAIRHDTGTFTCRIDRGRVAYVNFDGIRGL